MKRDVALNNLIGQLPHTLAGSSFNFAFNGTRMPFLPMIPTSPL